MKELEKRREERLLQEKMREVKSDCLFALRKCPFFFSFNSLSPSSSNRILCPHCSIMMMCCHHTENTSVSHSFFVLITYHPLTLHFYIHSQENSSYQKTCTQTRRFLPIFIPPCPRLDYTNIKSSCSIFLTWCTSFFIIFCWYHIISLRYINNTVYKCSAIWNLINFFELHSLGDAT